MLTRLLLGSAVIFLFSCRTAKTPVKQDSQALPAVEREFRAAWVATVANINWPSKPGLSTDSQQKEAIYLLDFLKQQNFNAVILQVRPQADALYKSDLEPWSYYLSGVQGQAPVPFYDPLEFWTEEAHNRGIELHVWLNPYRAHHKSGGPVSEHSVVKKHPELVVYLKEGYWWMDPGKKETQDLTTNVIMDLVKRYDIDGVHFDDYFYPYPSYNLGEDFPDSSSWNAYVNHGGKLSRGDWRRENVNTLIKRLYAEIKKEKAHVKFGLSPFGIWRPGHPASVEGFDQYSQLYADAKLWLNEGWIDYFTPQLYWPINRYAQSFPVLLGWWQEQNWKGRHLWPGISVGRDTGAVTVNETINQIMITRGMVPQSPGVVHWSIGPVTKNTKLQTSLLSGAYRKPALVPASPWMDAIRPLPPVMTSNNDNDSVRISWTHPDEKDVFKYVVYYKYGNRWSYSVLTRQTKNFHLPTTIVDGKTTQRLTALMLSAVDRVGNESVRHPDDLK
jgi:uncharacterized lipoprotein YddW (UPF0748 family)